MDELTEIADRLYAGPADGFTEARNAAAREVDDKALAAQVKKLKKPSVAAWAINLLVRRESEQIDSVLELAESLRAAAEALDGDELRALTRQRRQLTTALASTARSLAREAGVRLTGPVVEQVEGMLNAAMLDPVAAQAVRTGRVVTAFTSTGVSELDVASVVALPDALDVQAVPVEGPAEEARRVATTASRSGCTSYPTAERSWPQPRTRSRRPPGTRRGRAGARRGRAVDGALNARRLQLQGEADELRRRAGRDRGRRRPGRRRAGGGRGGPGRRAVVLEEARRSHAKAGTGTRTDCASRVLGSAP